MKTAISLPDELFREADEVAERLALSRSQLYARALSEFVGKYRADEIRESYDRAYAEPESEGEAAFRRAAARKTLKEAEW